MAPFGKIYDDTRERLSRVLAAVRREPTGTRPSNPVRIKLGQLPAPLRAVVRDESHGGILIEAELPWLTVGSDVQAEFPDGREKAGRVQWFGVDATRAGSARLRIFVDLSASSAGAVAQLADVADASPRPHRWRRWAISGAIVAFAVGLAIFVVTRRANQSPVQAAPAPSRVQAAPAPSPAPPREAPPAAEPPSAVVAPAPQTTATPAKATPSRPKLKRKRH